MKKFFKCILVIVGMIMFISSMMGPKKLHKYDKLREVIKDDEFLTNAIYYTSTLKLDLPVFLATVKNESNFDRYAVNKNRNGTTDYGYCQLNNAYNNLKDPFDPKENIRVGSEYLQWCIKNTGNNIENGLLAYNGGIGNFYRDTVPESTKKYAKRIMEQKKEFEKLLA